jgi:hypothetical protein
MKENEKCRLPTNRRRHVHMLKNIRSVFHGRFSPMEEIPCPALKMSIRQLHSQIQNFPWWCGAMVIASALGTDNLGSNPTSFKGRERQLC